MQRTLLPCLFLLPLLACGGQIDADEALEGRGSSFVADDEDDADDAASCVCADGREVACGTDDECAPVGDCHPQDEMPHCSAPVETSTRLCRIQGGTWRVDYTPCNTPLVLSFDGKGVTFTHPQGSFDVVGRGASFETDWVGADTPWLALDRNGNGTIDDGSELFGSMTELSSRVRAANGFEALAALDDNHDGRIDRQDAAWDKLVLWSDLDQDRSASPRELRSLASRGVIAIALDYHIDTRCVGTACEVERARIELEGGRVGEVIDVHFAITR